MKKIHISGTIFEELLREIVGICYSEFKSLQSKKESRPFPFPKESTAPPLLSVKQFVAEYPSFTEGSLRHLIFHAETNGFKKCIRLIGRRVLIHREEFFRWIDDQNK